MLFVSMPTYRTPPDLLARAVLSVLDQTAPDVRLIVTNDGGPPLALPPHSRLIVDDRETNRGRYWRDATVLAAARLIDPDGWFAVHDADDWSEPDRFARLLDVARPTGAALAHYWRHQIDGRTFVATPALDLPDDGRLRHVGHWCSGVYSIARMDAAGGIHPGYRIGFDTLHTLMMRRTGPLAVDPTPGYHWCRRNGGLSTARETRQGSRVRYRAKLLLGNLYRDAFATDDPGAVIRADVKPAWLDAIDVDARRLAERLA